MRLLLFNLVTDADDPILGFTTRWIQVLAKHLEFIHVVTMRAGRIEVPKNVRVYSIGKERNYSEVRRALNFYKIVLSILRSDHIDVCFSHMIPIFTIMAAPILTLRKVPIITWYAHPSLTFILKVSHHLSTSMVTSLTTAYPYKKDKLVIVGQGIDIHHFTPAKQNPDDPPIVLCVGRVSKVKDHPTLLTAAKILHEQSKVPFQLVIVGATATRSDETYIHGLHRQVDMLRLKDIVRFVGPVTMSELPEWYRRCAVHVNLTPSGFGDKVAWEAMSCGRPCLGANPGFRDTFGKYADMLLFHYGDPQDLAEKLETLLFLSLEERSLMGSYLRERVSRLHGLDGLGEKLALLFQKCLHQ